MSPLFLAPSSAGDLAILLIAAATVAYLLSLRKTAATWWLIGFVVAFGVLQGWHFAVDASLGLLWSPQNPVWQGIFMAGAAHLGIWCFVAFAYRFLDDPFPRETRVGTWAVGIVHLALWAAYVLGNNDVPGVVAALGAWWVWYAHLWWMSASLLWAAVVFARKAVWAQRLGEGRPAQAFWVSAGLALLPCVWFSLYHAPFIFDWGATAWLTPIRIGASVGLFFGLPITYLLYAPRPSTIQARLVGLGLVAALGVMAVVSAVLAETALTDGWAGEVIPDRETHRYAPTPDGGFLLTREPYAPEAARGEALRASDFSAEAVALGFSFPFGGARWDSVYVSPNGLVSFGQPIGGFGFGGTRAPESLTEGVPQIRTIGKDLDPTRGGAVRLDRQPGRATIAWDGIPQFETLQPHTVRLDLFESGALEIHYDDVPPPVESYVLWGVWGVHPGGPGFTVADFHARTTAFPVRIAPGEAHLENAWITYRVALRDLSLALLWITLAAAAGVLVLFGILFRGSLVTPLQRLIAGVRRVDAGDLNVAVPVGVQDELGELAGGFNGMTASLKTYATEMETLVGARTAELEAEKETVAKQAEALRALDEAKSEFFANVTHEFRTPLTLTLGPLDDVLAGDYGAVPEEARQPLALARTSAGRVLGLINQILDVARLEAGQTRLRARELDLGAAVRAQVEAFSTAAVHKHIGTEVDTEAVRVWADPEHLATIVRNLLANAFKFTPTGGAIRVSVAADRDTARVSVRDSGPGIAPDDLPRVFDRFYQVRSDAPDRPLGTGIGLSLARELAGLHGGQLMAESEVGFGSTFTLALPLGRDHLAPDAVVEDAPASEAAPAPTPAPASVAVLGGDGHPGTPAEVADDPADADDVTTVLLVEDQPDVRAYVRRHIEKAGYRVVEAADGEAGLEAARRIVPDLVVSDVMMPRLDGLGLCRALKADSATDFVPVVLLTAKAAPEDRLEGIRQLADAYLTKPFAPAELVATIAARIAVRQQLRARFQAEGPALAVGDGAPPALTPSPVEVASAEAAFVASVREAIEAGLGDEDFNVGRLAEAVGLSRSQLHRRLKDALDETPSAAIRTMRLERAAQLLEARAGTVSEVAYAVGFKSVAHFSTSFQKHHGRRPSDVTA